MTSFQVKLRELYVTAVNAEVKNMTRSIQESGQSAYYIRYCEGHEK